MRIKSIEFKIMKMRKLSIVTLFICLSFQLFAQKIQWQNLVGGSLPDRGCCLVETDEGTIIFGANSFSNDKDIPNNSGPNDIVISKMEPDGQIVWLTTEGGTGNDWIYNMVKTNDGGVVAVGFSESTNGTYSTNHGKRDGIILKFNGSGTLVWKKILGGSNDEVFYDLLSTSDGGFIVAGNSNSTDGDLQGIATGSPLNFTGWLLKIDKDGNTVWQKLIGNEISAGFFRIVNGLDGGYFLAGSQVSYVPDTPNHYGGSDIVITKVDALGNLEWTKNLGGTDTDQPKDLLADNGNYLLLGSTESSDNDIPSNRGKSDAVLFSIDVNGEMNWVQTYGFLKTDKLEQITVADNGNYLLSGITLTPNNSWLLLVDRQGNKISEKLTDELVSGSYRDMIRNRDGAYTFIGTTDSQIDNLNKGVLDIWLGRFLIDFNSIVGKVYVDLDENGIQDTNEVFANNIGLQTQKSNFEIFTNASEGLFELFVQNGEYTTSVLDFEPYFTVPENGQVSEFTALSESDSLEFRLIPTAPIPEVTVDLFPRRAARPGFLVPYLLVVTNNGNIPISGEVSVKFLSNKMTFEGADKTNLSSDPAVVSFAFSDLKPFQQEKINLNFQMGILGVLDFAELLTFESSVPEFSGELNIMDNIDTLYHEVVGSYDPNDKTIITKNPLTPEEVEQGHFSQYMIRFQNTGTDTAFNIVIADTISSDHYINTFRPITSSHPYRTEVEPNGSLQIFFDDILLEDSVRNEQASHGFFIYEIQLNQQISTDSLIENTAYIYFDFNPPVVTNTTQLRIETPIVNSNREVANGLNFAKVYPNPVSDILKIDLSVDNAIETELKIFDLSGKLILSKKKSLIPGKQTLELNCESIPVGAYSLSLVTVSGSTNLNFSKI